MTAIRKEVYQGAIAELRQKSEAAMAAALALQKAMDLGCMVDPPEAVLFVGFDDVELQQEASQ